MIEQTFSQVDEFAGSIEDSWGNMKETLLDILNNDFCKMRIAPRKPEVTSNDQKIEERRKSRIKHLKSYRRLNKREGKLTETKKFTCRKYVTK